MSELPNNLYLPEALQKTIAQSFLDRLSWMTLSFERILLVEPSTYLVELIRKNYPAAVVNSIDQIDFTINFRQTDVNATSGLNQAQLYDLILSDCCRIQTQDWEKCFKLALQQLKANSVLMLAALGLDTLRGIALENTDVLIDMHDLGDNLIRNGFQDPVLDVDHYVAFYHSKEDFMNELKLSPNAEFAFNSNNEAKIEVEFEIVYAHAFAAHAKLHNGEVRIPVAQLRSDH